LNFKVIFKRQGHTRFSVRLYVVYVHDTAATAGSTYTALRKAWQFGWSREWRMHC